ncbi:hypothetical protein [Bilophila wadsworthia]
MKNFRSALLAAALPVVAWFRNAQATTKIRVGAYTTPHWKSSRS